MSVLTYYSQLPQGISFGFNDKGKCLIATQVFEKSSLVYTGYYFIVDDSYHSKSIYNLIIDNEVYEVPKAHHTGTDGCLCVAGFDSFMNHSCDPNSICLEEPRLPQHFVENTEGRFYYYNYALKTINIGDEITEDYALFYYDDKNISKCLCQSSKCRGFFRGFKYLTLQQQCDIMADVEEEDIMERFLADNPNIEIVDLLESCPSGIEIVCENDNKLQLVSTIEFQPNEIIFTNKVRKLKDPEHVVIVKVGNCFKPLTREWYRDHQDGYVEFLGFDTFRNHSDEPNTYQRCVSEDEYSVYAGARIPPKQDLCRG